MNARLNVGLVACILTLAACGPTAAPSNLTSASPMFSPLVSPSPVPPSPAAAYAWHLLPPEAIPRPAHLYDIATWNETLFAVGYDDVAGGVIWSSPTGEAWTSATGATPISAQVLRSIAVGDPGIVVVGWSETDAVALYSDDGVTWVRHSLPGSHAGSSAMSVAWAHGRFVAVGGGGEPNAVVSWTSTDGSSWAPLSILEEGTDASLNTVGAGSAGFVVAGRQRGGASTWASKDGVTWHKPVSLADPDEDPFRVRSIDGRFVLAGTAGRLWTSVDGIAWTVTTIPAFGVGIFDVAPTTGGVVAVGRAGEPDELGVVAFADSTLKAWTVLPPARSYGAFLASAISLSPDGQFLVGVGSDGSSGSVVVFAHPATLFNG